MTRVAVTGGSGKLGRAVVRDLREHGYEVVNLDSAGPREQASAFIRIDLTDYGSVVDALTTNDGLGGPVEAVVHLPAIPAPGVAPTAVRFANTATPIESLVASAARRRRTVNRSSCSRATASSTGSTSGHHGVGTANGGSAPSTAPAPEQRTSETSRAGIACPAAQPPTWSRQECRGS